MIEQKQFIESNNQKIGDNDSDVYKLNSYLVNYGYLANKDLNLSVFESKTEDALKLFQKYFSLSETGVLDKNTSVALNEPRCGVPDLSPSNTFRVGRTFVSIGCSYQAQYRILTYAFLNSTGDIPGDDEREAIRKAMRSWEAVTNIGFREVLPASRPSLKYSWHRNNHGDGSSFDGPGRILAHAFYPPSCGGIHAGSCHFDEDEKWGLSHGAGQFDLETVALHEIGHLLGLAHSNVFGSVMYPNYGGQRRALTNDDIDGIQSIYGKKGLNLRVTVHLQSIGDAYYIDNEFAGTRGHSRRLEGFQIEISTPIQDLSLEYMAHLQGTGDIGWVSEGQFVGTRGQSRRLEGLAIKLTGANAGNYNVIYMAHLQGIADTQYYRNGQFCGTRGQSRRLEGLLVRIEKK